MVVEKQKDNFNNQPNVLVNRQVIEDNSNQSLSGLLENEVGVSAIKSGSGISKPVVHGLYGNRLTIVNNGIIQSGQQWGNDHAPEIDPFTADKITVLKGVNAIEYGGNLGSVIVIEPMKIDIEPHLHGQLKYAYETNGKGNTINTRIEKYSPILAWRINGTFKKYGYKETSFYYLNNTGVQESNFSVQLEKSIKRLSLTFYASTFNTEIGVLRGSHIGNLTDLEQAWMREIPFFTEAEFSYDIDVNKQKVSHYLAKTEAKYFINENQIIELVVAGQLNQRKEFDIRRSGRTDIPALSLEQYSFNSELKYSREFKNKWNLIIGNQNTFTKNTNNYDTGILPLIPDYVSWKGGLFSTLSKSLEKTHFNTGVRYDSEKQEIVEISDNLPREIIRYQNIFHNLTGLLGKEYDINKMQSISMNSGFTSRNPAVNELYSRGLHQGISGIEEGDMSLQKENAFKQTLGYKWLPNTNFSFEALAYHQYFQDYIYLNPKKKSDLQSVVPSQYLNTSKLTLLFMD